MSLTQVIKIIGKNIVLCKSFVLSCIKSIFGMEVCWENWPHTSLLWKLGSYGNQIETSVTHMDLYLVWSFLGKIDISHIPRSYGNLVGIATTVKP